MKLTDLKKNNLAYIKEINISNQALKLHLMEMGLVKNTPIKITRISKDKNLFTVFFRNYELTLSNDIAMGIEVV